MVPYWLDQDRICDTLFNLYPPHKVTIAQLGDGHTQPVICWPEDQRGSYTLPLAGEFVLVLGDLGCLAKDGEALRRFWLRWGHRLREHQSAAVALVPARLRDISKELARTWTIVRWGVTAPTSATITSSSVEPLEQVLTLLSPVVRLEPGLLRGLSHLIPAGGAVILVWKRAYGSTT